MNTATEKMALRHDTRTELEQKLLEPLKKLDDLVIRRESVDVRWKWYLSVSCLLDKFHFEALSFLLRFSYAYH